MNLSARKWQHIGLVVIVALPLLIYGFVTIYARFMADDFCAYDGVHDWGIFRYTVWTYVLWSGRLVHNFSMALLRFLPSQAEAVFAVFFLALWWATLFLLIRLVAKVRGLPNFNLWAALTATLILVTVLTGSANVIQTIYWESAIVTYLLPLVLLTLLAWVVLQDRLSVPTSLILCAVLAFIAGGYSEIHALMQTVLIVAVYFVYAHRRPQFQRLLVAFAFSFLIMLIVVLAPGNTNRQASSYPTPNIANTIKSTLTSPAIPAIISVAFSPFNCAALVLLPALIAYYYDKQEAKRARLYLLIVLLTVLAASAATFAVAYYATSNVLPARALMEPQYIMLWAMVICGYLFGLSLRRKGRQPVMPRRLATFAAVLLVAAAVMSSAQAVTLTQRLQAFAQQWDQRDAEIQAFRAAHPNSTDTVTVISIPNRFDIDEIISDGSSWVNQCAAHFYNVAGIVAAETQ